MMSTQSRGRRRRPSSAEDASPPTFDSTPRRQPLRPSATLLEAELVTEEEALQERAYFGGGGGDNPRSFPPSVKQQCWDKAERIKGRDPDRWRRDPVGNVVFRKLVGCAGCLCHDFDHILPYSKGGKSTLDNCQVLQAKVNRSKGNQTEVSKAELIRRSAYCRVSGRDMDLLELSAYGNVHREESQGGCNIQ